MEPDWERRHRDHSGELQAIRQFLETSTRHQENIMSALDNLAAADNALKAEVTSAISDWAAALASANSANDPAIQAVADDMNAQVAALQSADPANVPASTPAAPAAPDAGTAAPVSPAGTSN